MSITSAELIVIAVAVGAFAIGALVSWLAARQMMSAQTRLRETFQALSAEALQSNNRAFLDLAESRLREARSEAASDIDARRTAIEHLVAPLQTTLSQVDRELRDAERSRVEMGAQLLQRIASLETTGQGLRSETARLVDALKRPGVRGRWGELQLKRVVELAGMIEHCDFDEQTTIVSDDRRMRPDLIVHLPGGRHVVVDAKVPLDAYLKALEATDEASRQALLCDHARQVRAHLTQLAAKGYAAHVQPSPDLVVMFLPGEMFLSAALEQDASLIEFGAVGLSNCVIPASPTTLIALLRAVAYGWRQEAMEENARKISDLGRQLYESARRLGEHFDTLGTRLKSSLDAYNNAVGSLEGNVLVKARKFKELQAAESDDIKPLETIDRVPRVLQAAELTGGLPFGPDDSDSDSRARDAALEKVAHV
jgi:DNA recombination protein RmuC